VAGKSWNLSLLPRNIAPNNQFGQVRRISRFICRYCLLETERVHFGQITMSALGNLKNKYTPTISTTTSAPMETGRQIERPSSCGSFGAFSRAGIHLKIPLIFSIL